MTSPRSVRLSDEVLRRLNQFATGRGASVASVMERLLDEALRREAHPGITFRDGPSGRRAGLIGGPDVDEVIRTLRTVQEDESDEREVVDRVVHASSITPGQVRAAIAYYADHPEEIDSRIATNQRTADEREASWRRQQEILSGRSR
ncbi:hypothetical protein FHU33_1540 [Blastococcus colisei]|uniref:Uncharacterized protein n=1 Tax=Blastococcus colisei TaxID=1564162 RepID=A0A543PDI3_9ACTN|nr:CopG family transcriptional regulator [Blastococcus colisei]TQN42146.1 hypothetical protein FHU33_1540 [Blastococcus colisei]